MKKTYETIVFFGSGPVAAKSLEKLGQDFKIEAVITKPKPKHHKYPFPVIETAKKLGLPVLTTKSKQELNDLFNNPSLKSKVGVVIDYGIIIPERIINFFPLGIINSHFSLLPKYRGADPITFAVLNGDNTTGVSLMLIVPALDEGPLLAQKEITISDTITTPELTNSLIDISHNLLLETLPKYINEEIEPYDQSSLQVSYSTKLDKNDGVLDWNKPAKLLERQVRAFIEWPRSRTVIGNTKVIVTKAHAIPGRGKIGEIYATNQELGFYTLNGIFMIDELIPEGKNRMSIVSFLQGYKVK